MDWIQQWQSNLIKKWVAPLVRTGGSRHTGLAALPHRNIQNLLSDCTSQEMEWILKSVQLIKECMRNTPE